MFDEVIEEERAARQAIDQRQEAMNGRMDNFMREMLEQNVARRGGSHPDPAIPAPSTPNVQ
eukprot:2248777-Prorocentrum_lima.AAC.1